MRRLLPLLLLFLLAPALHAAVSGTVLSPDGKGLAGARVAAYVPVTFVEERQLAKAQTARPELASATTDARGAFTLQTDVSGVVELLVVRDGFAPGVDYVLSGSTGTRIELTPAVNRTGRVIANSRPVAGAAVIAMTDTAVLWTGVTAEDGTYSIPDPSSWASEIAIVHPDWTPVVLEVKEAKLDATLSAGSRITGTVVRADGTPAANARVTAGPWVWATTGEDGAFVLRHVPGEVKTIEAFAGSAFGSSARARSVTIDVVEGRAIEGTVRDARNRPLAGVPVRADAQTAVSNENGRFRLEHLAAGEYVVTAYGLDELGLGSVKVLLHDASGRADLKATGSR